MEKNGIGPLFYTHIQVESRIKDLIMKGKLIKSREENIRENFCGLRVGNLFINNQCTAHR